MRLHIAYEITFVSAINKHGDDAKFWGYVQKI